MTKIINSALSVCVAVSLFTTNSFSKSELKNTKKDKRILELETQLKDAKEKSNNKNNVIYKKRIIKKTENKSGWFVNYSILSYSGERTFDNGYATDSADYDASGFKMKLGRISKSNMRISINYTSLDIDFNGGGKKQTETALELDFTKPINKWRMKTVTPYINWNIGLWTNDGYYANTTDDTMSGLGLGLGLGIVWNVNKHIDAVIGYDTEFISWTLEDDTSTLFGVNKGLKLGMNLKF